MFNKLSIFQFSHYLALLFLSIIELGFCRSIAGYTEGINVDTAGESDDDTDYRDYSPDITNETSVHNNAGEMERLPTAEARGGGGRGGGGRGFRGGGGRRGRKWGSRGGGRNGSDGDQEDSDTFYIILLILYIILSCCSCLCPTEPNPDLPQQL